MTAQHRIYGSAVSELASPAAQPLHRPNGRLRRGCSRGSVSRDNHTHAAASSVSMHKLKLTSGLCLHQLCWAGSHLKATTTEFMADSDSRDGLDSIAPDVA